MGSQRVGHDLATKPPLGFKSGSTFAAQTKKKTTTTTIKYTFFSNNILFTFYFSTENLFSLRNQNLRTIAVWKWDGINLLCKDIHASMSGGPLRLSEVAGSSSSDQWQTTNKKKKRTRKKRPRGEIWFLSEVWVACRLDLFVEGEIQEWSQDRQEEGKVSEQLLGQTFLWITTKIWWRVRCLCPGRYILATFCILLWRVQGVFGSQIKTTWSEETWRLGYG